MKISDELIGKEVIDESGDQVGIVEDVEWNIITNSVESLYLKEAGLSAKFGLGDNKIVPYSSVDTIGEKVLTKGIIWKKE